MKNNRGRRKMKWNSDERRKSRKWKIYFLFSNSSAWDKIFLPLFSFCYCYSRRHSLFAVVVDGGENIRKNELAKSFHPRTVCALKIFGPQRCLMEFRFLLARSPLENCGGTLRLILMLFELITLIKFFLRSPLSSLMPFSNYWLPPKKRILHIFSTSSSFIARLLNEIPKT